jgi:hypothetical protein
LCVLHVFLEGSHSKRHLRLSFELYAQQRRDSFFAFCGILVVYAISYLFYLSILLRQNGFKDSFANLAESMSDTKTIEVEPVDEGVRLKPKRQLTETQLANLKKGREKLAEKRKAEKEQKEKESETEIVAVPISESEAKTESETQTEEDLPYVSCAVM